MGKRRNTVKTEAEVVRYGRIVAPFKLDYNQQSWFENVDKIFTIENQCILNESSGGHTLFFAYTNIKDLIELPHCSTCLNQPNTRKSTVYNFALTVHHPSIVESYCRLINNLLHIFDTDQLKIFENYFNYYKIVHN
ncbi:hypothetical protein I4U23_027644 [Adineta vaga]|nr:hypothetical protein I4U23_027644 [Adineta vaga]